MKNAKKYLVDFINFSLIWSIVVFLIYIIILGAKIEFVTKAFKAFIPLAFFLVIFLIKWKLERMRLARKKFENMMDMTLYLSYTDKFIDQMVVFSLPVLLIFVAVFRGSVDIFDIIQACLALLVLSFWHYFLFKNN